jgi:hypothetical protein
MYHIVPLIKTILFCLWQRRNELESPPFQLVSKLPIKKQGGYTKTLKGSHRMHCKGRAAEGTVRCFLKEGSCRNCRLVMATLAKRKRTKASILVFSSISKRSEHLRSSANYFRNEANTLDRTKIIFEAKRTCPSVRKLFSNRSELIR